MPIWQITRSAAFVGATLFLAGCVTIAPVVPPTAPPGGSRPTARPTPTLAPTPTLLATPAPTLPPTEPPTPAPTEAATEPPTEPPTAPPTAAPTAKATATELDPNLGARYFSLDPLESGFEPDPIAVTVKSGGPIDATYLGGDCTGYAEPNPDYEVHYVSGDPDLLRFYFVADTPGDDATLIINDAASHWRCSDDAYGSNDPSIAFESPQSGWYDIWIGSYSAGDYIAGTLYITELDSKHP